MDKMSKEQNARLRSERGPLYLKISTLMRRNVETGLWPSGHRLLPLTALAAEYGVAVVTVRQAVAMLEEEGLLHRYQGRGTFVTDDPKAGRWLVLRSDWSSLLGHLEGKKPKLLKTADNIVQPNLTDEDGTPAQSYQYMQRIHLWDDLAYAVIDIYLDREVYRQAREQFDSEMVIATMVRLPGVDISNMHQTISFTTADPETARLLDIVVNAPVGDVRRVITAADGTVLYVGEVKYRGDFVKLEMNMER